MSDVNQQPTPDQKQNDKELNFRTLEAKYQKALQEERQERERLTKELQEKSKPALHEDDETDEPYVDHKRLDKKLNKFGQNTQTEIQKAMEFTKEKAKQELKQEMWLENHNDFYEILGHAEKFATEAPELAETILRMPENFERQKLVYQNIKRLGIDKPKEKQQSIQDKIDANKRSPYYQPSGVGTAPYASTGDFSPAGQKNAHAKMKELQARLRI